MSETQRLDWEEVDGHPTPYLGEGYGSITTRARINRGWLYHVVITHDHHHQVSTSMTFVPDPPGVSRISADDLHQLTGGR